MYARLPLSGRRVYYLSHKRQSLEERAVMSNYLLFYHKNATYAGLKNAGIPSKGQGIRSTVAEFSKNSRKRLLSLFNSIDKDSFVFSPCFITLTYPSEFPVSFETYKRHLANFVKVFVLKYSNSSVVWRLEYQKRGAPHFHLIVINSSHDKAFVSTRYTKKWISETWYRIVGSGDQKHLKAGTNCKRMASTRQLFSYVSKYAAKNNDQAVVPESSVNPGRFWGVANRTKLVITEIVIKVSSYEFFAFRRILSKYISKQYKRKARCFKGTNGITAFISDVSMKKVLTLLTCEAQGVNSKNPLIKQYSLRAC